MKKLITFFALTSISLSVFAANVLPIEQSAANAAIALAKVNWAHMEDRLDLQVFGSVTKGSTVKVELLVGSVERPARMHVCTSVTFDGTGIIKRITNVIDSGSCK